MIESLRIEDLGVIEAADLTLSPGLTALTGETGAGKTMVLTSLGLLLGQRADASSVRAGAARTVVEGAFTLAPGSRAELRAREAGAELDDDLLLATRTVPVDGRSRAHLGGRTVPSSVLAEVGAHLVSVHGQSDQLRLRSASAQRAALDSLGGPDHAALCRRYAAAYRDRKEAAGRLEEWRAGWSARAAELEALRGWLEVIDDLAPRPGEDRELTAEADRLDHVEDLRRACQAAHGALAGAEESAADSQAHVLALLAVAQRAVSLVGDVDPALRALAERMDHLSILASDVAAELGEYLAGLDADPARLMWVQDRRGELSRALREVGGPHEDLADVDALIAFAERAASRVAELDGPQDTDTALEEALARADRELGDLAARLSSARRDLAVTLEQRVSAELEGLEMRGARLVVDLEALEEPGPTGAESVSLLLSPHPGAAPLPVGRGASGGELSRIMLALEVVLADGVGTTGAGTGGETGRTGNGAGASAAVGPGANRHRRTFVFDEIDAGVGGRAAREIGRRLARLARRHQVVVVTHLPQVAAWADQHLVVVKEQEPEPQAVTDPIPDILQEPGGDGAADARPEPVRAPLLESRAPATAPGSPGVRTRVVAVEGRARVRELARMLSGHEDSRSALRHAAELLQEARVEESRT